MTLTSRTNSTRIHILLRTPRILSKEQLELEAGDTEIQQSSNLSNNHKLNSLGVDSDTSSVFLHQRTSVLQQRISWILEKVSHMEPQTN